MTHCALYHVMTHSALIMEAYVQADAAKQVRFQMIFDAELIEAVDDWSYRNRVRSRSEAIRKLLNEGLINSASNEKADAPRA